MITGESTYFAKKVGECMGKIDELELQIIRSQNKKASYMTELSFLVTKKIILYIESCRDAEEGKAFAVRHLEFDDIWNKVELGENFDITLPPCLESKLRKNRPLPQDAGYGRAPDDGRGGNLKRGRENYNRNQEDRGEVAHNHKTKKQLLLDKQEYAPLIHNFVRHRDNKRWVPTRGGIPKCLKFHLLGHCWEKCNFGHEDLNAREEQGMETLINMAKDLKMSQRRQGGNGRDDQRGNGNRG